jgi:hypothetical protein
MKGRLLGLAGKAGCGKSTIAQTLVDRGLAQRVRFAGPLKDGLVAMGLSREQVDGSEKETPTPLLCGRTPRYAMQKMGTEFGRDMIGPDVWVRLAMHRVDELLVSGVNVVIDDLRFDNEAQAILERDGQLVTLRRGPMSFVEAPSILSPWPLSARKANWLDRLKTRLTDYVIRSEVHASEVGLTIDTRVVSNDGSIDETVEEVLAWWDL